MISIRKAAAVSAAAGLALTISVGTASAHPDGELDDGSESGAEGPVFELPWGDGDAALHEEPGGGSTLPDTLGPDAAFFVDSLVTADRYGLPIGPVLDQLGAEVRAERSRRNQQLARTLPVKLSFPLVVCTLPSFVLLAIAPAVLGAVSEITG